MDDIITTNWDPYFERYCGATPFVTPDDFVFWDMPGRKVFKIHGSVTSYSSIVATSEDYAKCEQQLLTGLVGSNLRMLLATKVVVFVGYSFRDDNFTKLYSLLRSETKNLIPQAYAITISVDEGQHFQALGLTPIITDGTHFVRVLKDHLVAEGAMISDDRFDEIPIEHAVMSTLHSELHRTIDYKRNPSLVYCAFYQDGYMDALGRILQCANTGEYSCSGHFNALIMHYERRRREKKSQREYFDVAYIDGYMNGLLFLVADNSVRKRMPRYYVYGYDGDIRSLRHFTKVSKNASVLHKAAFRLAVKHTKDVADGTILHHRPFFYVDAK